MATRRKSSTKSKSNIFSGVIIGLVLGLGVAVAVAFFITQAPMPFMDKASRGIESILLPPDPKLAPDPNQALYGSSTAAGSAIFSGPEAEVANQLGLPSITSTPQTTIQPTPDSLDNLIAQLSTPETSAPSIPKPPAATPSPAPKAEPKAGTNTYFLQAGAFHSAQDADAMRARIIMLGLHCNITAGELNGKPIHRVRVGPFQGIDDMNKARSVLVKEKIETSVVRQ